MSTQQQNTRGRPATGCCQLTHRFISARSLTLIKQCSQCTQKAAQVSQLPARDQARCESEMCARCELGVRTDLELQKAEDSAEKRRSSAEALTRKYQCILRSMYVMVTIFARTLYNYFHYQTILCILYKYIMKHNEKLESRTE